MLQVLGLRHVFEIWHVSMLTLPLLLTRVGSIHFFLIFKFKFIDFEKIKFKFKFIDFKKTKFKFKFIDFEKSKFKFKFIDFAKVEFKFINNLRADSNSQFKLNPTPTFYTQDSKRILQFAFSKSQMCTSASQSGPARGGSGGTSYPGPGGGLEEFRFPR